jgi:hypothetical protein
MKPRVRQATKAKKRTTPRKRAAAPLTPEAQARLEAFRKLVRVSQERSARLTPAQRRNEHERWLRAMNMLNEGRYRKSFVE